jgi:hypothetical protein
MDTEPENNKSPAGCLGGTAGIIGAIAALVTAITGLVVALHGFGSDSDNSKSFSAVSHRSKTNANGYGSGTNERTARNLAIGECIGNGGVPECCARDLKVSPD